MQLAAFLAAQGLSYAAFAPRVGLSAVAVSRHARGLRLPRPRVLARYETATGGQVTPADFYAPGDAGENDAGQGGTGKAAA